MKQILTFFHTVLSKYLAADPLNPALLNVCASIFDWEKDLHKSVIPWYVSDEVLYFDTQHHSDKKRALLESEWRLSEVKPGLVVDVVRTTKVDKEVLKCWVRGTVLGVGMPGSEDDEE